MASVKSRFKDKMNKISSSKSGSDNRFFAENYKEDGQYVLRLTCDMNGTTFAEYKQHTVTYKDGDGREKRYTHICCKVNGQPCPTCDKVTQIWADAGGVTKVAQEKLEGFIKDKNVKVTNVKIVKSAFDQDVVGQCKLFKLNGETFKSIKKQEQSFKEAKDANFIEADPFDPLYSMNWNYKYITPKSNAKDKKAMPSWETSFQRALNNVKGDILGVGVKENEETGETVNNTLTQAWVAKAEEFMDKHEKGVQTWLEENTTDLTKYMEEIKSTTPTEEDVMKNIGTVLFGAMKNSKTTTTKVGKEDLYKDDDVEEEQIDDEEENSAEEVNETTSSNTENSEVVLDDDDELPF